MNFFLNEQFVFCDADKNTFFTIAHSAIKYKKYYDETFVKEAEAGFFKKLTLLNQIFMATFYQKKTILP